MSIVSRIVFGLFLFLTAVASPSAQVYSVDGNANSVVATLGAPLDFRLTGPAGSHYCLFFDTDPGPVIINGQTVPVGIGPNTLELLGPTTIPPSGIADLTVTVPDLTGLSGFVFHSVGLILVPGNQIWTNGVAIELNASPQIVSVPPTSAIVDTSYQYPVQVIEPDGETVVFSLDVAPVGMTIDASGLLTWTPTMPGTEAVVVRATDTRGGSTTQAFSVTAAPTAFADLDPPIVAVSTSADFATPGNDVLVAVEAIDNVGVTTTTLLVDGVPTPLDAAGQATINLGVAGPVALTAQATDAAGNTGSDDKIVVFVDATVTTPPTADITSPANGATLTGPTDIVGTAASPGFSRYVLEYAETGTNAYASLVESSQPVSGDVLGTFDPTLFCNGVFDLRLTVENIGGLIAVDTVTVEVDSGEQKIGLYTLTFNDIDVAFGTLPLGVVRTYDSRMKTSGDFGIGWTINLSGLKLVEESSPSSGWVQQSSGGIFGSFSIQPTRSHIVRVYVQGRGPQTFNPRPNPNSQPLIPITFINSMDYIAVGDTVGSLVANVSPDIQIGGGPGPVEYFDFDFAPYDPSEFTYTDADGFAFRFREIADASLRHDLRSITDPNGNVLTIDAGGISSSSGASFGFVRDAQGRITSVIDPMGNSVSYEYNTFGQLEAFVDQLGNRTEIYYDAASNLTEIIDPLGNRAVRNEYDAEGRLVATVDPQGNRIEITHDVGASQEVITDRNGNPTIYAYDTDGNILAVTDALGNTQTNTFDADGRKLTETDFLGNVTTFTYDADGNMLTSTDPLGNMTTMTYGAANRLASITDALDNTTSFAYDGQGNVTQTTDPFGRVQSFSYGSGGRVDSTLEPGGAAMTATYDGAGNPVTVTDQDGSTRTITYDGNGNPLTVTMAQTQASGAVVTRTMTNTYDALNRVVTRTGFGGDTQTFEYDAVGRVGAIVDAEGRRTEFAYDALGQVTMVTHPDGTTELSTYDAEGSLTSSTDAAGRITTFDYDALNRLVCTTHPDGTTRKTTYDANSRVLVSTDENGHATQYVYDAAGRNTQIIDATSATWNYGYDARGQQTSVTDPNGNTTTIDYDALGRQTRVLHPDGAMRTFTYDATGHIVTKTDEVGSQTVCTHDANGRLMSVTDALGSVTSYFHDEFGNLVRRIDAEGRTTTWDFDGAGRTTRVVHPLGQVATWQYDAAGNMTRRTDSLGIQTDFTYDIRNRLASRQYPDGTSVAFTYTTTGQREAVTLSDGRTTTFTYDGRDRVQSVTDGLGRQITYGYDGVGNRTSLATSQGTTTFSFDAARRVIATQDGAVGGTSYAYDAAGNLATTTLPNGVVTNRTFDTRNQLLSVTHVRSDATNVASFTYTLRPDGRRIQESASSGRVVDYDFDALGRLVVVDVADPALGASNTTYTWDGVGNRLTSTTGGVTTTNSYDDNDRLLTSDGVTFGYDDNGNRTSRDDGGQITTYDYDFENRLADVQSPTATSSYRYDDDGTRLSSTVDGATTEYLVDKNRRYAEVLEEHTGNPTPEARNVVGLGIVSRQVDGATNFFHGDGLGSTRVLTDTSESETASYTYDAFGNLVDSTGAVANIFLFAAQQIDPVTGFYYLRARYYDPVTGQMPTRDFVPGDPDMPLSLHPYLYAFGDPVNGIDPSGNLTFSLGGLSLTISVQGVLTSIAYGAAFGGILGAADAFFGGGDVLQGFLNGALLGGVTAPFGLIALQVKFLRILLPAIGVVASFSGIQDAIRDRDYDLAAFRATVALAGLVMLGSVNQVNGPPARLTVVGPSRWQSPAGAVYGPDPRFGNRVLHVLNHASNQNRNVPHGVFTVPRNQVLSLVDEAYTTMNANRALYARSPGGNAFDVPVGRIIGFEGGGGTGLPATTVRIVTRTATSNEIITAFPAR